MEVIVDGDRGFRVEGQPVDALAVLAAINDHLHSRSRAILSLKLNGTEVAPQQVPEMLRGVPIESVETLEVGSEDLGTLINTCLSELRNVLPDLPKACRDLAAVFHGDQPDEGYQHFTQLANIWSHVKTREKLVVNALDLNLHELQVNEMTAEQMHAELNQFLEEAITAIRNGDTVLLGDLLDYELAPRAEKEAELVDLLQARAAAKSG
ncbi:MAG: hypothetical protein HYV26_06390 [Candidatus Hydrogenedentes bacterium]|nr:hypothetical protein [Candidatus Hydrogenedentota bacterium]